jgi:hypothetical protein
MAISAGQIWSSKMDTVGIVNMSYHDACKLVEQLCLNLNEYHCSKSQDYRDFFNTRATECEEKLKDLLRSLYATPPLTLDKAEASHPQRCIDARNRLNTAIHGEGAVIDDLETAVHQACLVIKRNKNGQSSNPTVPEGLRWFTVAQHGMPEIGEVVIGGLWHTDPWLKPECATHFIWGQCRVLSDSHRDFKDGKRWHTFGPSHNDITHWARLNIPKT